MLDEIDTGVGVADKAFRLIEAIAVGQPRTLAQLTVDAGLPRATAHRLLAAMESHRVVSRDETGRYLLGLRLARWGTLAQKNVTVAQVAQPVLDRLQSQTGESAQLFVRDGNTRVCVAASERLAGLRDTVPVGTVLPLTAGSGGRILLAWSDDERSLPGATDAKLRAVRQRGWAATAADREPGVASISAPIFDRAGKLQAALSLSGPLERLHAGARRTLVPLVIAAAKHIQDLVG